MSEIIERGDVRMVEMPDQGDGYSRWTVGLYGVTAIKIVKRKGPFDWMPFIEVWAGDRLHAEVPQYRTFIVEFQP